MTMVPKDVFPKFRPAVKLSTRQDGDGNEVEVEIRENEDQSVKLQEIIDLLVAAGYFRARIKGLPPFDKVVGGMIWCIESCNIDVDVDFLFQENATIGQKIALTEKIVAVLPKMKCPHNIEPHQIQGLDFIHIFPVIQWLVKRSMEFRQETFEFIRLNAVSQFDKTYRLESELTAAELESKINENIKLVRDTYRPQRHYRLKDSPPEDDDTRVQITLLEYGYRGPVSNVSTGSSQQTADQETLEEHESEELQIEHMLKNMAIMNEKDDFGKLDSQEKAELLKHYESLQAEMQDGGVTSKEEKQLALLQNQKEILEERCTKLKTKKGSLESKLVEVNNSIQETKSSRQEANKRLALAEQIEADQGSDLQKLEQLVFLNESLREQEVQFKEQCRVELEKLQKKIEEAQTVKPHEENKSEMEKQLADELEKVQVLRLQLAKKNRAIATFQRKLDDIPSRAELAQYQRRFLELYNQVAAKHKETKQYYTLYNTLEDTKTYIRKEFTLLNSILDSYPEAMSSNSGKEEFIQQFEAIVEGVKQTKAKVESRFNEEQKRRDELSQQLMTLVEQQRKYVVAVRQLSIECRRNEVLLAQTRDP